MNTKRLLVVLGMMLVMAFAANAYAECVDDIAVVLNAQDGGVASGHNCPSWEGGTTAAHKIMCRYFMDANGVERGECWADDADNEGLACTTTDAKLLRVIASINPGSYIYFNTPDGNKCKVISTETIKYFN